MLSKDGLFAEFDLPKMVVLLVSIKNKQTNKQECKVDKLKFKKLEVIKPRIKNKSEVPTRE